MRPSLCAACVAVFIAAAGAAPVAAAVTTWDGRYPIDEIEVTVVYFVPSDREPLVDWGDRAKYFCRRIEAFHEREFQGQSTLTSRVHPQPFVSQLTTETLRQGDANAIYFRTLREVDEQLKFARKRGDAFPILLVLSDINWRPLDDFYRLNTQGAEPVFEGNVNRGEHFPGAASGGARAAYLGDRGVGWALVSGDGWRVPYRGSDCVVYHEGCGHSIGLPHPEPGNGSVMSMGQYRGWINESWLDKEQKSRLGWSPKSEDPNQPDAELELFTRFRALPDPVVPLVGDDVSLKLDWPASAAVKKLRVRFQTAIAAPWIEVDTGSVDPPPAALSLGRFDRETPISYRVDVELENGASTELWGYVQVRSEPQRNPLPRLHSMDLDTQRSSDTSLAITTDIPETEVDLLAMADPGQDFSFGEWTLAAGKLQSPKQFGARLELPYSPPDEYRLILIVEPLDEPNGLILGHLSQGHRFATLFHFLGGAAAQSAIENIDGKNVGNESTFRGELFRRNRLSQVIVQVRRSEVQAFVDGRMIVHWQGDPARLSLSDYWSTPQENALLLGAYDCRYRFHRITLENLSGKGTPLRAAEQ